MSGLLNLGSIPLDGLLNSSIAGLSNPGLIDVNVIYDKDIYVIHAYCYHILGNIIPNLIHNIYNYPHMK